MLWTSLGLNQGPPDYELQQMQHSVMPCDCPFLVSLFVYN